MGFDEIAEIERIEMADLSDEKLMVSVWCITYNHKNYIKDAIEGFLNQKTSFKYEIVIFDDASTDGTSEIVRSYAVKYPNLIKAHLAHKNTYNHPERRKLITEYKKRILNGRYIASCEGDDYWIYDQKLQKQYDWMESHPDTSLCIHNAIRYDEYKKEVVPQIIDMDTGYVDDEEVMLNKNGLVPAASFFFRSEYFLKLPYFYEICPVGDDPLRFWLAYNGNVYYMDKVWAVRNYMHEGSWNKNLCLGINSRNVVQNKFLRFLPVFDKETNYRFHKYVEQKEYSYCLLEIKQRDINNMACEELRKWVDECKRKNDSVHDNTFDIVFYNSIKICNDYGQYIRKKIADKWNRLYIYGAGIEAQKYGKVLAEKKITFAGFVVTESRENSKELMGYKVFGIDEIAKDENTYFWLCMNSKNRIEVIKELLKMGIRNIL